MDIKELLNDDNAVSPVIGVILMVAITVILAAVIASFVLGLGDQAQNTTPTASFNFDYDTGSSVTATADTLYTSSDGAANGYELTVTHDSGDDLDSANLELKDDDGESVEPWTGDVTAGTSIIANVGEDDTVRVVWTNPDGGSTSTLATYEAPEA